MSYGHDMRRSSGSKIIVHALAFIGVTFWLVMIVRALMGVGQYTGWKLIVTGLVLGAAHLLISLFTRRRSAAAIPLIWFVLVADLLQGVFVNPKVFLLVGASIILLAAGYACRRAWNAAAPLPTAAP